jgi:hypothetical protein
MGWRGQACRSRLVAAASGAPVLRDQGPDWPIGHGNADYFPGRHVILIRHIRGMRCCWSGEDDQLMGGATVTVVVRSIP